MKQSQLMSLLETGLSTVVGFVVALLTQLVVFPLFGFTPRFSENLLITLIFTIVSIVRQFGMRRLFEALHVRRPLSPFMVACIEERYRQIEKEGWSAEHDNGHKTGELAKAGGVYARVAGSVWGSNTCPDEWPWELEWWKPAGFRRDLVKATALIFAEGEKFDRNRKRRDR